MACVGRTNASPETACKLLRGGSHLDGKVVAELLKARDIPNAVTA